MAHAEKCPVCNAMTQPAMKDCNGCDGKGWVEVSDSTDNEVQFVTTDTSVAR